MDKYYWFYIDSITHISYKNSNLLCYYPYTGEVLEFPAITTSSKVQKLIQSLLAPKNLRIVRITAQDLQDTSVYQFVHSIRNSFMGDLLDTSLSKTKPFQMPPMVKNEKDIKFLKSDNNRAMGENMMNYLDEVTLYLNDSCSQKCLLCNQLFKQATCCTAKKTTKHSLNMENLKKMFIEIQGCHPSELHISGGDIFSYEGWLELLSLLQTSTSQKNFYINYLNLELNSKQLQPLQGQNTRLIVLMASPVDGEKFQRVWESLDKLGIEVIPRFFIQSNLEYDKVEVLLASLQIKSAEFIPFYNGENLNFFKENLFIQREDFEKNKPNSRFIYANSMLNTEFFGKLTLLPNGGIYSNLHSPRLGILGKDSIYDCVFKEMKSGRSWRKLRKNVRPCRQCNFEQLCPPISNLNFAMGRFDLCQISDELGRSV